MKVSWLNLVLYLTNKVYQTKQLIFELTGFKVVKIILKLISYEFLLAIISFPLYLTIKPEKVVAFMNDKGSYDKINSDYNLRRLLTLSGVSLIVFVWLMKLFLTAVLPIYYAPLQLYTVSEFQPVDSLTKDLIAIEMQVETAELSPEIIRPQLKEIKKNKIGDYMVSGMGQPNSTVVLLLSEKQAIMHLTEVDQSGYWQVVHQQKIYNLREGNHSVIAFTYDQNRQLRSEATIAQYFKVTTSWVDNLLLSFDKLVNWLVVIVIGIGLFLILLTI